MALREIPGPEGVQYRLTVAQQPQLIGPGNDLEDLGQSILEGEFLHLFFVLLYRHRRDHLRPRPRLRC